MSRSAATGAPSPRWRRPRRSPRSQIRPTGVPELPEVETVARDLRTAAVGQRITRVQLSRPDVVRHLGPEAFAAGLRDTRVEAVERLGKLILCAPDSADELVIHPGITGHLWLCDAPLPPRPHTHRRRRLQDGPQRRLADARSF